MSVAVVTGASSGIGAASALALAKDGWQVVAGARRLDRLNEVAAQAGLGQKIIACRLDVTDQASVDAFAAAVPECDLLVNNAGGAHGSRSIAEADEAEWRWMYEVNVLGTLRMTRAFLPKLLAGKNGLVINMASIAGHAAYAGGGGYNAAKFAENSFSRVLRAELAGRPVRVTAINPGMVETEFSLVRFGGDQARADAVYEGITPLTAEDVAECVRWVAGLPAHVNIDVIDVMPRDQIQEAGPTKVLPITD